MCDGHGSARGKVRVSLKLLGCLNVNHELCTNDAVFLWLSIIKLCEISSVFSQTVGIWSHTEWGVTK